MGSRTFKLVSTDVYSACPKCGSTTFVARSAQVAEDGCEVWVECKCGHDPTAEKIGYRVEDVWGSLDVPTILTALDVRQELLLESP